MIAEHSKELITSAAGLRNWGQHSPLTSQEAGQKKHLLGSCMVGTLECRMSHVVSGATASTWVKQQMPGSLSSLLRDDVSVKAQKQIVK